MRRGRSTPLITFAALAASCSTSPRDAARSAPETLEAHCAVAQRADLDTWVGDVVTLCTLDRDDSEQLRCRAGRVDARGQIEDVALPEAPPFLRALPAGERWVLLLEGGRLVLTSASGAIERELASWASDPWISDDGARIAWVGLAEGVSEPELGAPTRVLAQGLDDAAPTLVIDDALASTPRPVPGSDDVLFVSAASGVAGMWIAGPGRAPEALTNVGIEDVEPRFVPVADRELAWSEGALVYAAAELDRTHVWRLELASREVREIGPGRWPRIERDGSIIAALEHGDPCATRYPTEGAP